MASGAPRRGVCQAWHMHERARIELERRGRQSIYLLLETPGAGGYDQGAIVNLGLGLDMNPSRAEVEAWLREQDEIAAALESSRHDQLLFWGKVAGFAAIAAVVVGIISIVITYLAWTHPVH